MDIDLHIAQQCVNTNVFGTLAVSKAVAIHMAKRGQGKIVNIGSVVGYSSTPWAGIYSLSKAAVHSMSDTLRLELKPFGIQVIVVAPGAITSNIGNAGAEHVNVPQGIKCLSYNLYFIPFIKQPHDGRFSLCFHC
jgi:short-subunit dehydrogenase